MKSIAKRFFLLSICLIGIMFASSCSINKETKKGLNGSYTIEKITINDRDKKIFGKLYLPLKDDKSNIVILSNDVNKNYETLSTYSEKLADYNIASFVFDFVGGSENSKSSGNVKTMSLESGVSDLEIVLDYIKNLDDIDKNNIFLFGEGQGGIISTNVAIDNQSNIKGLMLLNPMWTLDMSIYKKLPNLNRDVIIIHSTNDEIIPISYSEDAVNSFKYARLQKLERATHEIKELYQIDNVGRNIHDFITYNNILDEEIEYQEPLLGIDMNTLYFYEAAFAILKKSSKMIYPSQYIKAYEDIGDKVETIGLTQMTLWEMLNRQWHISDLDSAMSVYKKLVESGKKNKSAWDLSRAMSNLYFYYLAGYIDFKTAMDLSYDVATAIQSTFVSWEEYNDSYLKGYSEWSNSTDRYEDYQELISEYRNNPFIKAPFDTKLIPYEKPVESKNKNDEEGMSSL